MFDDRHAKLTTTNGGFLLEFATKLSDGSTDEDYLELGWKKLVITDPPNVDPSLFVVSEDGYDETETQLVTKWKITEKSSLPIIISKYKFIAKLMEMNLWDQVKQLLEDNNLIDLFNAAQELNSEDQFFKQGIQLAKSELGITDEQIQQFIEQVVA